MDIQKITDGNCLTCALSGRLDTNTAPQLENEMRSSISGISTLIFDLDKLTYVSSAGLRIFLSAQKIMNKQGKMIVRNVSRTVMDIFEVTGFVSILTIEND